MFETGQTSEPTSANISIVARSSKRGPTMLRSFAQHIQQCCAGARALHATYPHKYMRTILVPRAAILLASASDRELWRALAGSNLTVHDSRTSDRSAQSRIFFKMADQGIGIPSSRHYRQPLRI